MVRIQNVWTIAAAVSLVLLQGSGVSQSPPGGEVRFKIQSDTVVVDVIVTDSKGNIVPGLSAVDFKISEDGVPQKIAGFEAPSIVAVKGAVAVPPSTGTAASAPGERHAARLRLVTLVIGCRSPWPLPCRY